MSRFVSRWTDKLDGEVLERLGNCRSTKADLPVLVNARWSWMKEQGKDQEGLTKEDALACVLDLLDSNGQWMLADLTREEYDELAVDLTPQRIRPKHWYRVYYTFHHGSHPNTAHTMYVYAHNKKEAIEQCRGIVASRDNRHAFNCMALLDDDDRSEDRYFEKANEWHKAYIGREI